MLAPGGPGCAGSDGLRRALWCGPHGNLREHARMGLTPGCAHEHFEDGVDAADHVEDSVDHKPQFAPEGPGKPLREWEFGARAEMLSKIVYKLTVCCRHSRMSASRSKDLSGACRACCDFHPMSAIGGTFVGQVTTKLHAFRKQLHARGS